MATFDCNKASAADVGATQLSSVKVCEPTSQSVWQNELPNEITSYQADYTTVSSKPISMNRSARKGTVTDVEVAPGFQTNLTIGTGEYWIPPFLYSKWTNNDELTGTISSQVVNFDSPVTIGCDHHILINGQKAVINDANTVSGATIPDGTVIIKLLGVETNVTYVKATNTISMQGSTIALSKGSYVYVDGKGFARVKSSTSADVYVLDNNDFTADFTEANGSVYFGAFVSNVAQDSPLYYNTDLTFEARFNTEPVTYQYARGVRSNQLTLNAPLSDLCTMDMTFLAEDLQTLETALPGSGHVDYILKEPLNTVTNISRVRIAGIDDQGISTYMKDVTLTINNNAAGEKTLGRKGNTFTSLGDLEVTMNTETVMTDAKVLKAIEENATVNFTLACNNNDGAIIFDMPSAGIGNGAKTLNRGEKVKIGTDLTGFYDDEFGYVIGVSLFTYLPKA